MSKADWHSRRDGLPAFLGMTPKELRWIQSDQGGVAGNWRIESRPRCNLRLPACLISCFWTGAGTVGTVEADEEAFRQARRM